MSRMGPRNRSRPTSLRPRLLATTMRHPPSRRPRLLATTMRSLSRRQRPRAVRLRRRTRPRHRPTSRPRDDAMDPPAAGGSIAYLHYFSRYRKAYARMSTHESIYTDRYSWHRSAGANVVLAWASGRRLEGPTKGTGGRRYGPLRQIHAHLTQGADACSGQGAAIQPKLHRDGTSAPRSRPRGRGCRHTRAREPKRRTAEG